MYVAFRFTVGGNRYVCSSNDGRGKVHLGATVSYNRRSIATPARFQRPEFSHTRNASKCGSLPAEADLQAGKQSTQRIAKGFYVIRECQSQPRCLRINMPSMHVDNVSNMSEQPSGDAPVE